MPGGVLGLYALRSRAAVLLRGLPYGRQASTMPCCQPPLPMQSGRPVGPSGPATGIVVESGGPSQILLFGGVIGGPPCKVVVKVSHFQLLTDDGPFVLIRKP